MPETQYSRVPTGNVAPDVGPGQAAVLADLHVAVSRSGPVDVRDDGRFRDLDHGARFVGADAIALGEDARLRRWAASRWRAATAATAAATTAAGVAVLDAHDRALGVVEVLPEPLTHRPRLAAIERDEEPIAAEQDLARIVRRDADGGVPGKIEGRARRRCRHHVALTAAAATTTTATATATAAGGRPDAAASAGAEVVPVDVAVLRLAEQDAVIGGIHLRLEAVTTADAIPVIHPDRTRPHGARPAPAPLSWRPVQT